MLDDLFMKTFSVFRNAGNPLLLILQDQLFRKLGEVIQYPLCDARYCPDWKASLSQTPNRDKTTQQDLASLFNISDSQSEQVPSNGNFRRGWIMIKVMND